MNTPTRSNRPTLTTWVVTIISVALFLAFCSAMALVAERIRLSLTASVHLMRTRLSGSVPSSINERLSAGSNWLGSLTERLIAPGNRARMEEALAVASRVVAALNKGEYERARQEFAAFPLIPVVSGKNSQSAVTRAKIEEYLEKAALSSENVAALRTRLSATKSSRQTHHQALALIASDLTELLGLPPNERARKDEPRRYTAGVLLGLPIIAAIPENIATIEALRDAVLIAGGTVTSTGKDPLGTFSSRLESLRDASDAIYSELDQSVSTENTITEQLQDVSRDLVQYSDDTARALIELLSYDLAFADLPSELQTKLKNSLLLEP